MNRIGIRYEDKNQWERRVPLTPHAVEQLVRDGIEVRVQSSATRIFPDEAYEQAGALVVEDLRDCDAVLAVKEIPEALIESGVAYVFFSHTIKGQAHSMPLLRRVLDTGATLIDYESIADEEGARLVHFGRFAGLAGMVDALGQFGRRWLALGVESPLTALRPAYEYDDLPQGLAAVAEVGALVAKQGLPDPVGPLVIGVTGYGKVGHGALEVLDRLPRVDITPADLTAEFVATADRRCVYVCVFTEGDTVARDDGAPFTVAEFRAEPGAFHSVFAPSVRQLSILVNSVLWQPEAPRLLTIEDLSTLMDEGTRLTLIADLSCDISGGIEATVRATTSDEPVFVFDPVTGSAPSGFSGAGLAIQAVDNLPCEFPAEASMAFSAALAGLVPALAQADFTEGFDDLDLPRPLKDAVVAHRGKLTPRFAYLADSLRVVTGHA